MIKEIAQKLYDTTIKGEYKNFRNHEKAIEELKSIALDIKNIVDNDFKTDAALIVASNIGDDCYDALQILDKAEKALPNIEDEIEDEFKSWQYQQDYAQKIFNER